LDIDIFLKERTKFTLYFHENASKPFIDIMEAIEKGDSPYDNLPYSEDGEPAFLTEWLEANDAYNSVGLASLSMLSSAVQLYLSCWADRVERSDTPLKRKSKKGWLHAYKKITKNLGVNYSNCPVKFEIIEQIVLARNRTQHEEDITSNCVKHCEKDLSQHPSPHFVSDLDRKGLLKDDNSWWMMPQVHIDKEKLDIAVQTIEEFCYWLEMEYERILRQK
jgi:hypothetical protein